MADSCSSVLLPHLGSLLYGFNKILTSCDWLSRIEFLLDCFADFSIECVTDKVQDCVVACL